MILIFIKIQISLFHFKEIEMKSENLRENLRNLTKKTSLKKLNISVSYPLKFKYAEGKKTQATKEFFKMQKSNEKY